ncbi:MAG: hypothetical protein AAF572_00780 [Cyanobacteria bacterium P01_B01_bin.77]
MDATVQLALMAKAIKVFASDDTFLSFPVTPLQFTSEELNFLSTKSIQDLKNFSMLVNQIPDGEAWSPVENNCLWDIYEDVLHGVDTQVAWSTRTEEEEIHYQNAIKFLRHQREDGNWENSDAVKLYKHYEDQWFMLNEAYAAVASTAETSEDQSVRENWQQVKKPQFLEEIEKLKHKWINDGFKQEVEEARAIKARLGAKSPGMIWEQWKTDFNPDISSLTSTDGTRFYPSIFFPKNAIEEGSWQPFPLEKEEIKTLLDTTSPESKSRLNISNVKSDVISVSFEFSSAAIDRPWYDSDLFKARFWRFSDEQKQLSDGLTPPTGYCPAYVTAVVFARKVTVKKIVDSQKPESKESDAPTALSFSKVVQKQTLSTRDYSRQLGQVHQTPTVFNPKRDIHVLKQKHRKINRESNLRFRHNESDVSSKIFQSFRKAEKNRPKLPQAKVTRSQNVQTSQTILETMTDANQIYILAFTCKRLPTCPNADQALQW